MRYSYRYKPQSASKREEKTTELIDKAHVVSEVEARHQLEARELGLEDWVIPVPNKTASTYAEKQEQTLMKFESGVKGNLRLREDAPVGQHSLRKLTQRLFKNNTRSPLLSTDGTIQSSPCETIVLKRKEKMINPDSWHLQLTAIGPGKDSFKTKRRKYLLAIQISRIEFFCHSLMMEEEVLARDLLRCYHAYQESGLREKYSSWIEGLHHMELELLNSRERLFLASDRNEDAVEEFQETLRLEKEVYTNRQELEELSFDLIDILQDIINKYSSVEEARKKQGHNLTSVKMDSVSTELQKYRRNERRLIWAEYESIQGLPATPLPLHAKFNLQGYTKHRRLESTCAAHSITRAQLVEKLDRLRETDEQSPEKIAELESKLEELGFFPRRIPLTEKEKREANSRFSTAFYSSILPLFSLYFVPEDAVKEKQTHDLLSRDICITQDHERIHVISDLKKQKQFDESNVQVCLRINDQVVGRTECKSLKPDYHVPLMEDFRVFVHSWPESVTLQLIHSYMGQISATSNIELEVPLTAQSVTRSYEFESNLSAYYQTYRSVNENRLRVVSGTANVFIRWEPPTLNIHEASLMVSNPLADFDKKLSNRIVPPFGTNCTKQNEISKVDYDDVKEPEFYVEDRDPFMHEAMDWTCQKRVLFFKQRWRLTQLIKEGWIQDGGQEESTVMPCITDLTSHEDLERSLATMRHLLESEITAETHMSSKDWNERREKLIKLIQGLPLLKAIEEREERLKQLYVIIQRVHQRNKTKEAKLVNKHEVVRESMALGFRLDMRFVRSLFTPPKKLRPKPKHIVVIRSFPKATKLVVSIRSASNLPQRNQSEEFDSKDGNLVEADMLSPFVEICVNEEITRTPPVYGPDPLINRQLEVPFIPKSGVLSPCGMKNCSDLIEIRLFDEVPGKQTSSRRAKERRFLGHLNISLATVYHLGKVEGTFKVHLPDILLNYKKNEKPALISVFVSFDPPLPPPNGLSLQVNKTHLHENRTQSVAKKALELDSINKTLLNLEGEFTPCTNFISKCPLPDSLETMRRTCSIDCLMHAIAEFVKCIPSLNDSSRLLPKSEICQSNSEFVRNAAGHEIEHAHLLAGLFLNLDLEVYIVLGISLQATNAAFVLTKTEEEDRWWNPMTGHSFLLKDTTNELRTVRTVYNNTGVWRNLQEHSEPWTINWNFKYSRFWRYFDIREQYNAQKDLMQQPCSYEDLDMEFYVQLESKVEELARRVLCSMLLV
eukprot:g527.t1